MAILSVAARQRRGGFELDVTLDVAPGVTAVLGPSGAGKTSLLRLVAGLERPDRGRIGLGQACWFDSERRVNLATHERRIGYVFQEGALFPHLSVRDNVAFGATDRGRVAEWLRRFELSELAGRRPGELSGGQRQRVAIARALASEPELLLMDEPFSSLDAHLKDRLYGEVQRVLQDLSIPVVLVTHDLAEAALLSERLAVLARGRLLQEGTPEQVLTAPVAPEVARLVGIRNVFEVTVGPDGHVHGAGWSLRVPFSVPSGRRIGLWVRPKHVRLAAESTPESLPAVVRAIALLGANYRLVAEVPGLGTLEARLDQRVPGLRPGEIVRLRIAAEHLHAFPVPGTEAVGPVPG